MCYDIKASLDAIEVCNYHEEVTVDGITFKAFAAGHVLGAAMFQISMGGSYIKIL